MQYRRDSNTLQDFTGFDDIEHTFDSQKQFLLNYFDVFMVNITSKQWL